MNKKENQMSEQKLAVTQAYEQIFSELEHLIIQNKIVIRNRKLKAGSYDLRLAYVNGSDEALSNLAKDVERLKAKFLGVSE